MCLAYSPSFSLSPRGTSGGRGESEARLAMRLLSPTLSSRQGRRGRRDNGERLNRYLARPETCFVCGTAAAHRAALRKNCVTCGLCPYFVVHFVVQGLESSHHGADPAEHFLASTCLCLRQQSPLYTQIQIDRPFNRSTLRDLQKACFALNLQFFVSEHLT